MCRRGGAGQAPWAVGTQERRPGAFLACPADTRVANKPAQHVWEMLYSENKTTTFSACRKNKSEWKSWERCQGAPAFRMLPFCCGFQ